MQRHILALAATLAAPSLVFAQTYRDSAGTEVPGFAPLAGCSASRACAGPVSASNPLPVTGSFAATLNGFAPGPAYATPLSVTTASSSVALPAGTTVVIYNTGSNPAFVQLGGPAVVATTANDVVQPASWMSYTVGSNGFLAAVTSTGATSLNISGGSGLPTGGASGQVRIIGALPAGTATIGNVGLTAAGGATLGAATAWGTAPGGNVQGVNANVLALPPLPAGANTIGNVGLAGGDPCMGGLKSSAAFSSSASQFRIIAGTAAKKTYVCHLAYRVSAATAVSVIEGTGTSCATGAAAMDGSTTASNGKAEAVNGGEAAGNGSGDIMHASTAASDVCILQSGAAIVAGRVTYVQQ